jgi:hypothetical protein
MGHFVLQLLTRGGFCPKGYFLVSNSNDKLLCQKSEKAKGWLFSCDFPKFNAKKVLSTTLLFEKCQTADSIFFLCSP